MAIAGCLGAPASGETEAGEQFADEGEVNASPEGELVDPAGGSDLAGSASNGEPDWIDAHNMRFRGWYYAEGYNPPMPYHSTTITLAMVNNAGYSIDITAFDRDENTIYENRLNFNYNTWFRRSEATTVKISVVGSAQSEALEIDLTDGAHHEIWFSGAVLTASYWIGHW
ncbi:hypothetical protein OB955_25220 [Halobacteria archaeon AArc-m2/3/4]|uniref:Uncharacterized protein n=1 Tax=Natronoglomus mannanivorans TaxID=2979990 RepID=A0ABT2QM77_9EURY|nr:hypothetical protein [Halobacteria archaeon AArc-m2/3/4]